MTTNTYRKKPVVIEAFKWNPEAAVCSVPEWYFEACGVGTCWPEQDGTLTIRTLEGSMTAQVGDWIIRGVKGEIYPCKDDIFRMTYEAASEGAEPVAMTDGREAFESAFLSANGFHTKAELAAEWEKGLSGVMFRAGLSAQQAAPKVPEDFVLVPMRETQAMRDVFDEEGWEWADLLAAAEAITLEQYNELAAAPAPSVDAGGEAELEFLMKQPTWTCDKAFDGAAVWAVEFVSPYGEHESEDDPREALRAAAGQFTPQPPAPSDPELVYCQYCQGSGEGVCVVGRGPDAHDEPCSCQRCGGTGVFQAGRVVDVGLLEYRGNSVSHIHSKMTAYQSALGTAWEALKKAGIRPDGNTSVAMGIERLAAPSEQQTAAGCTCPSGDGSLRWPCPEHPAAGEQRKPLDLENLVDDLSEWDRHVIEDHAHERLEVHVRRVLAAHGIRSTGGEHGN